jgi:hypothetical protein
MRSLALLLLLLNLGFLFWQLKWLPWLPWQPEQIAQWPSKYQESDLQRPVLLDEAQKPTIVDKSEFVEPVDHVQQANVNTNTHLIDTAIEQENRPLTKESQTDVKSSEESVTNRVPQVEKQAIVEPNEMTVNLTQQTESPQTAERIDEQTPEESETHHVTKIAENIQSNVSNQAVVNTTASEINTQVSEKISSTLQKVAGLSEGKADSSVEQDSKMLNSKPATKPDKNVPVPHIVKKPSEPVACFRSGPYTRASLVEKKANWLKTQNNVSTQVQTQKKRVLVSTWVYLPPFESRQAAIGTQERLIKDGIHDCYVVKKGHFNNAISLGLYRQNANVKPRLNQLIRKGYKNVKTQKRYKSHTKYWLNVKIFTDQTEWLNQQKKFKGSQSLTRVACESE